MSLSSKNHPSIHPPNSRSSRPFSPIIKSVSGVARKSGTPIEGRIKIHLAVNRVRRIQRNPFVPPFKNRRESRERRKDGPGKRSRSPFPGYYYPPLPHLSFLSPSSESPSLDSFFFPSSRGRRGEERRVSRRCNLRLNCQSTGYYFPVSLRGRSGRRRREARTASTARWPLARKRRPVEKTTARRRGVSILPFFSLNRRGQKGGSRMP